MQLNFEGFITDFEIDFLCQYLPIVQVEKTSYATDEEKAMIIKFVAESSAVIKDKQSDPHDKAPKVFLLRHLQRELHYIEENRILQQESEHPSKMRIFNSFVLALNLDTNYFSHDRFNSKFLYFDIRQGDLHLMHTYHIFRKFIQEFVIGEGGYLTDFSEEQSTELTQKLYLKMTQSNRFNVLKKGDFNKQALIDILTEARVFTGFEIKTSNFLELQNQSFQTQVIGASPEKKKSRRANNAVKNSSKR